jgi:tetratricopeptide (TPR) repeat protein
MQSRHIFSIPILLTLVAFAGCGRAPSPEQQQADSTLTKAHEALARGKHRESRELLLSALTLNKQLGRAAKIAEAQRLLGDIAAATAEYDSAILFYNQAIEQYHSVANRDSVHALTLAVAGIHRWIGEGRKALLMYTEALRLSKLFGDPVPVREIEWAMLPACRAIDDREEEARVLTELLNEATASGSPGMQARAYYEAGLTKSRLDDHSGAEQSFLQALTFADQSHDSLLAITILLKLAMAYANAGKVSEAFQMYTDGLKRSDITAGAQMLREEMLTRVGNIYLRNRQNAEAGRFYRAALDFALSAHNKIAEGYLFVQLGHLERETPGEAANNYRSSLDLFNSLSYPQGSAYALMCLGIAAQRANKLTDALSYFKSAIEQSEASAMRRSRDDLYAECESAFLTTRSSAYDAAAEILLQLGRYDEAFWYMERKKAHETFDHLGALEITTRNSELTTALAQFSHLKALQVGAERQRERILTMMPEQSDLLRDLQANLTRTEQQMDGLAERIVHINNAFEPVVRIRNLGLSEVQKLLPAGTVLVEHIPTARSVYAFAISNAKVSVQVAAVEHDKALSTAAEFIGLLRHREAWKDSSEAQVRKMDRRIEELTTSLYGTFIKPIEKDLSGASKLIIVRHEGLTSMPLHALRGIPARRKSPYLIERYAVSYLPSAATLSLRGADPNKVGASPDIVGFGHQGETSWDVEYELRDIRAFYKEARLYFDQQATLVALQNEQGDVLHLAAEMRCNTIAPGSSAIVLSDGKSANTTKQVLFGELFSVSSFSTIILSDLGVQCAGVEPSVPLILLMNGSSAVIANESTPARKTKKFFGEIFYTALLAGATTQAAFRQAQLEMIKNPEYSSAYLWAPFALWGK